MVVVDGDESVGADLEAEGLRGDGWRAGGSKPEIEVQRTDLGRAARVRRERKRNAETQSAQRRGRRVGIADGDEWEEADV